MAVTLRATPSFAQFIHCHTKKTQNGTNWDGVHCCVNAGMMLLCYAWHNSVFLLLAVAAAKFLQCYTNVKAQAQHSAASRLQQAHSTERRSHWPCIAASDIGTHSNSTETFNPQLSQR
eukprot:5441363-Amphidinium_carterae.1